MTIKISTGCANKLLDTGSLKSIFAAGFLKLYSGSAPADAELPGAEADARDPQVRAAEHDVVHPWGSFGSLGAGAGADAIEARRPHRPGPS